MIGQVRQICDNTSVGIIARDEQGRILTVKRLKYPFGFAPPAGHCDGDSYPAACHKEFQEETGLSIVGAPMPIVLMNPKKEGRIGGCRRGGRYHYWQVFEVNWSGKLRLNTDETKWLGWMTMEEIGFLACQTERYLSTLALTNIIENEVIRIRVEEEIEKRWEESPGLEAVWYHIFQELKII